MEVPLEAEVGIHEGSRVRLLRDTLVSVGMTDHLSCRLLEPEHENNLLI
jgi:hypothetical protein